MDQRYGKEVWNGSFKEVWNGGMERVWSRSLFRTSYFDLPPYRYNNYPDYQLEFRTDVWLPGMFQKGNIVSYQHQLGEAKQKCNG